MTTPTYHKPIDLIISTPDNKMHKAQFVEAWPEPQMNGGYYDREIDILVSPALIGKSWMDDEAIEMGEEPSEYDYDLGSLGEWISANIVEGGNDIEESDSITGLSYKVLNREDHREDAITPLYVFGEMGELVKAKDEQVWHGEEFPDVVSTSDPVLARAISSLTPQLPALIVELEGVSAEQLEIINKAPTHSLINAVRLDTQRTKVVNLSTSPNETVNLMMPALKFLKKTEVDSLKRAVLNGHTPLDNYHAFCEKTLDSQSSQLMQNASLSIGAEKIKNEVNAEDVLNYLPLMSYSAKLVETPVELNGEPGMAYHAEKDGVKELLGVSTPDGENTVTIYPGDYMKPLMNEDVKLPSPELDNKYENAPKI